MSVLSAEKVSFTYQSKYQKVHALDDVSCEFELGKFYAIVGQSGSGKTTLLSMLAGLGDPDDGQVVSGGKTVREIGSERHRRENVSVIYQSFNLFPHLTILENVAYPMRVVRRPSPERLRSGPRSCWRRWALRTWTPESAPPCSPAASSREWQ